MLSGLLAIALAFNLWYWAGVVLWGLYMGLGSLFNINTGSLRQAIVPGHLLGRAERYLPADDPAPQPAAPDTVVA